MKRKAKTGFDNEKYLQEQNEAILERVKKFDNRLYLEFGGKLIQDYHAARVLPGYDPNVKIRLLQSMKDKINIVLCIYSGDIEKGRLRGDLGITYDSATLKLIDDLRKWSLDVFAVVITRFTGQDSAVMFKNKLERRGVNVFFHYPIEGYPTDIDTACSDKGFGKNDYIKAEKPVVVVTAPGPNSGKLSACLSQMYHDHEHGINSGYAKFETFPIWNLPLKHPVNVAYEAATADICDFNVVDPFHLNTYGSTAINYNRDVESFPILKLIISRILAREANSLPLYNSPTDMGVNRAGFGITDDETVKEAARQELIRRYFRYNMEYVMGVGKKETVDRVLLLMEELGVRVSDRRVVKYARESAEEAEQAGKGNEGIFCGAAIELSGGNIITGKNSRLMHASSSLIINAVKILAGIPDEILLLSPNIINQKELDIGSTSTIRNHRFILKEKERQSKLFLTLMELLKNKDKFAPVILDIHKTATMVDERYNITDEEMAAAIKKYFPYGKDGVLSSFPKKQKHKLMVLKNIAGRFLNEKSYSEKEVNEVLKTAYEDYVTLRRYLIEYGFLDRKPDGSRYWVK